MTTITRQHHGFGAALRRLPADLGFLLATLPVIIVSFTVVLTLTLTGISLIIIWVGIPILVAGLLSARFFGGVELGRLALAGHDDIVRPDWSRVDSRPGIWGWTRSVVTDGRSWLAFLHAVVVNFVLGLTTWILVVTWMSVALGGLSFWIWGRYSDEPSGVVWNNRDVFAGLVPGSTQDEVFAYESVCLAIIGLVFLATLVPIARGLVTLHAVIAKAMLGERPAVALRREIAAAEASRESAVLAEDRGLRRLERDIHDGPQQRLLRLQYDLASAQRALDAGDDAATALVAGALQQSKDTLAELRDLSRGLAPPILQDRGLVAAVVSLTRHSTVPVETSFTVDEAAPGLADVERSAYFVVSELLANVTKHSGATGAAVSLATNEVGTKPRTLTIRVSDNGSGGASEIAGHGLAGLRGRLDGLRGSLALSSPGGGPTVVTVVIPLASVGS